MNLTKKPYFLIPNKKKIIITLLLFIFLVLGFFGLPPFGKIDWSTHVGNSKISPLLIAPLYFFKNARFNSPAIPLLVLLIYYYLLACILVYIYQKLKGSKNVNK